ncbi:hypothetical protein DCC81_22970 [Chitinophaga parva]|uniref:Glycoside hydrolase family 5 domain-containing protein n=1 Tax=Chitinophaga parva TaxID=2169414 RepID=A0A2T7BDT0_9BACT|nr:hypothetical protein [Chitinophaga parva]PUZ23258.1 hypothetical protein DCC81_22970 [Chitinophaga parva]
MQNWNIYDPAKADSTFGPSVAYAQHYLDRHVAMARQLKKPVVPEAFGISRDGNNYNRNTIRDKYYQNIFDAVFDYAKKDSSIVPGVNFWAWGGEGSPAYPVACGNPETASWATHPTKRRAGTPFLTTIPARSQ